MFRKDGAVKSALIAELIEGKGKGGLLCRIVKGDQVNWIVNELVKPLSRRAGTAIGGYLVAIGVSGDQAATIAAGAVALIGVAIDLALSYKERN